MKLLMSAIFGAFCLFGLVYFSEPLSAQSGVKVSDVEIGEVDVTDFPTVRVPVTVRDERNQHVPGLAPKDFEIKEDMSFTHSPERLLVMPSAPIHVSIALDMPHDMKSRKAEMIRYTLCQMIPNQFAMNQARDADKVEVWTPISDALPTLTETSNSGELCNWAKNLAQPTNDSGQSLNKILARLLSRQPDGSSQIIIVIASEKIPDSGITQQDILTRRSARPALPIFVFSFLDDGLDTDWNYLYALSSKDAQGNPLITDFKDPAALDVQNVNATITDLLHETTHYKDRYLLEYRSILPRSKTIHKLTVQVENVESLPKDFSTFLPQSDDWEPNTSVWIGIALIVMLSIPLCISALFFSGIRRFRYP